MAQAKLKYSTSAFRRLEAEFVELRRDERQTTAGAAVKAKAEARIKAICDLANIPERFSFGGERLSFGEHFLGLLRKRGRSSQDAIDYLHERDRLLARLGEASADKHRRTLAQNKVMGARADYRVNRDMQMAKEFNRRRGSSTSDSNLKAEIGKDRAGLSRSAAIEAINRGLKLLKR